MTPEVLGLVGIGVLLLLIYAGVYISISMALVGFIGLLLTVGITSALSTLYLEPFIVSNDSTFAVLPLYLLMGEVIASVGIGTDAFNVARAWFGQFRGGLAMAVIGGCALFAATSGSSMATAVVMGKAAFPEMKRLQYDEAFSAGCIAAGGSIGVMIPPSTSFIIIGIMTECSIGKLFIAGILPGITQAIFYMITIALMCKLKPSLGAAAPNLPFKEKVSSLGGTWPIFFLFILVIGGIYMGVFTPSESGAIGALGALLIGLSQRRVTVSNTFSCLKSALRVSGLLVLLVASAFILNRFLGVSRLTFAITDFVTGLGVSRYVILGIVLIIYIVLGMFFDIMAMLVLTLPLLFPVMTGLGFDPIWYGVMMCRMSEMGFISPPFGFNLFALQGSLNLSLNTLYRGVIPFLIADIFHVILLVAVPEISTYLPGIMK